MSHTNNVIEELKKRGLVEQVSNEERLINELNLPNNSIYIGFDPTADSLHVGHLLPMLVLRHFQNAGVKPIVLVGGATGMIGDPSGRSTERNFLTPDMVAANVNAIIPQIKKFVTFEGDNAAEMVNNYDWISPISMLDWLRDVGKHVSVNYMIAKESVKSRLEKSEIGLSYTEFSYMLLQAYDFLHLSRENGCTIQGGGNDQWGNITAGIELIRKKEGKQVFGITFPLITTSNGEKLGKSAGNAVWLSADRTSPYEFYQYWLGVSDTDADRFLRMFTFLPIEEIDEIVKRHTASPEQRIAQKKLAEQMALLVHGQESLSDAVKATEVLFSGDPAGLSYSDLIRIFSDVPSTSVPCAENVELVNMLIETGLANSRKSARRLIEQGGVYINGRGVSDTTLILDRDYFIEGKILLLRTGKKRYHLIFVESNMSL